MAGGYHFCIEVPTNILLLRSDQDESFILHVQFHGTGKNHYRVDSQKLERTFLTEFLKEGIEGDFHEILMKVTFNIAPVQEGNAFCEMVLERGIFCRQREYHFLGHSDTQLKKKSCYFMRASHEEIHQHLAKFGDFLAERDVGKRARKIGMLFLPLNKPFPLNATQYKIEPDIRSGYFRSYTFTDGCGFMSSQFSTEVREMLKIDYPPSVVHVRFRGVEGTLVLKEDLTDVKVQFHSSMQKFATPDENMPESLNVIDVVDYSRPFENGYLDSRMIMLLADRGVPAKRLMELQMGYHELIEGICKETAEYFLRFKGEFGLLRDIQANGIDGQMKKRLKFFRNQEVDEMKKNAGYTRILVPKSREVFAVCDPYNKLKHGECYFNPTMSEDEASGFPGPEQRFLVTRRPNYHPGDMRVLRMTNDKQGYENLRDCLVLPNEGPRPHAFECAGGTLGGNKFFVSWNKNLLPSVVGKPCDYPLKNAFGIRKFLSDIVSNIVMSFRISPEKRNEEGRKEMRQYFATFTDDLTERIDATYMKYAAVFGPSSKQCQTLSKLFYQALNLMEDRVILEREWLKLKGKEPSSSIHSGQPSPPTACNENSPLLVNEERCANETVRQPIAGLRHFMHRGKRPHNPSNAVREKIEAKSNEFVERVQREIRKIVA